MAWPFRPEAWGAWFEHACLVHAALAREIARHEPVTVLVRPGLEKEAGFALGRDVNVVPHELDDSWLRDTAPVFVVDERGAVAGVCLQFNGWGNRVHDYGHDGDFAGWLLEQLDRPAFSCPLTLEGSAVQQDAIGTLIALRSVVLGADRNPTIDLTFVEELLATFLCARKIIWLDDSPEGSWPWKQTCDLVRFCGPSHVLCAGSYGDDDPLSRQLEDIRLQLEQERDAMGRSLKVDVVPRAKPAEVEQAGDGLWSYLNYYLANDAVIVPAFGSPADETAQAILSEAFPSRSVMGLDPGVLPLRGMGFHSLTVGVPVTSV